jgi:hypothetical protein
VEGQATRQAGAGGTTVRVAMCLHWSASATRTVSGRLLLQLRLLQSARQPSTSVQAGSARLRAPSVVMSPTRRLPASKDSASPTFRPATAACEESHAVGSRIARRALLQASAVRRACGSVTMEPAPIRDCNIRRVEGRPTSGRGYTFGEGYRPPGRPVWQPERQASRKTSPMPVCR